MSATSLGGSLFREWTQPFPGEPIPRWSATSLGGRLGREWTQPFTGESIPRSRLALEDSRGRESRRTRVGGARRKRRGRKGYHGLSEKTISSLGRPTGNPTFAFSPVPTLTATLGGNLSTRIDCPIPMPYACRPPWASGRPFGLHGPGPRTHARPRCSYARSRLVGVGVLLFNHHLHRGHEPTSADPAGCSAIGALHATCKDEAPRIGAHKQPHPET